MIEDQLHAAMDTEEGVVAPRYSVLGLAARLSANALVHDTATLGAIPDGSVPASMIHVVARVKPLESCRHAACSFRNS